MQFPASSQPHHRQRMPWVLVLIVLVSYFGFTQEATYFALQRPGQGSVAIDKEKQTAYITDLGKAGDGNTLLVDNVFLLDYLAQAEVRHLIFTCSHPHSDHAGGIRALFEKPRPFFSDDNFRTPRFDSIHVIENGVSDSLFSILQRSLPKNSPIRISGASATRINAFAGISSANDDVFIESIPYVPADKPGPHGRSVVTRVVLGGKYSNLDFDDASSAVIGEVVNALINRKISSIDSFVVPHHGSAYHDIEPILRLLKPKVAIITVNPGNQFGHPSPSILLALIENLGAKNVLFTGSAEHVVLGPSGIKAARYTAATPESYELFVEPNYKKAIAKNDIVSIALFKKIAERMDSVLDPTNENGRPNAGSSGHHRLTKVEIVSELDSAEQTNQDLFSVANRLALSPMAITAEDQKKLENCFTQEGHILDRLLAHIRKSEGDNNIRFSVEKQRLELISNQINHELSTTALALPMKRPFLDNELQDLKTNTATRIQELRSTALTLPTVSRSISTTQYSASLELARRGTPSVTEWKNSQIGKPLSIPNQIILPYSEMISPKTANSRPGGIVIGNLAQVEGNVDLSAYVLRYDLSRKILVLKGPGGTELPYPHRIEPEVMKSLYRFAMSDRISAVSLAATSTPGIERLVRLDNAFVDSSVGRDLIASDLIGWRLRLSTLPDGNSNPLAWRFSNATSSISGCLGLSTRATLIDYPTTIKVSGNSVVLDGGLRLEFMSDIARGIECPETSCKNNSSGGKTCHFSGMERLAKENYEKILSLFPSLKRIDEDARIIAFLRWARNPRNLTAIDFSALVTVQTGKHENRTPDALTGH